MKKREFDRRELERILPHGGEKLLLDSAALEDDRGLAEVIMKNHPDLFRGHFTDRPMLAGVLAAEMAAQLCGLMMLAGEGLEGRAIPVLCSVDKMRFIREITPDDVVSVEAVSHESEGGLHSFSVTVRKGESAACRGVITLRLSERL